MADNIYAELLRKQPQANPYAGINPANYANLTSNNTALKTDFKPLNFDNLMNRGAVRVTHRGLEDGSFDPDPSSGFSLVSGYNDSVAGDGQGTRAWKDNPDAHHIVRDMFANRPADIGTHKYMQILQSAKDMGLSDNEIYSQPKSSGPASVPTAAVVDALRKKKQ